MSQSCQQTPSEADDCALTLGALMHPTMCRWLTHHRSYSLLVSAGWPDWAFYLSLISAACLYFASILSLLGTPCC